jgi:MOSC domain-containing protein
MSAGGSIVGHLAALWRYPVKSMMGEELNASHVTERGLLGDRAYALVDAATGHVASAKNPLKWAKLFECRAALAAAPSPDMAVPPARITLPSGEIASSDDPQLGGALSGVFGRDVFLRTAPGAPPTIEEYWPDIDGLDHRNEVSEQSIASGAPPGTFFDFSAVHIVTTATLDALRRACPEGRFEARRFRPNLVVGSLPGQEDFVENEWPERMLSIGDEVRLVIMVPAPRCVMTTLAQGDLPADPGILRALVQHNSVWIPPLGRKYPCVGVFARVLRGGIIRRGDTCRLE